MLFPDVIPLRPYTSTFTTDFRPSQAVSQSSIMYEVIIIALLVFLVGSLIRAVANQTTGIVISHAGFTPNPNITGSPGTSSVLQVFPLVFAFIGLAVWLRRGSMKSGV